MKTCPHKHFILLKLSSPITFPLLGNYWVEIRDFLGKWGVEGSFALLLIKNRLTSGGKKCSL
jgi:hypothetical protein